uniref:Putative histone-lysine n-methyltransferase setmar-like protein n=1 Tax=Xenopsylla cheopis TaxID=163159 RepID=A0A6M2DR05_XENCH
MEKEEFRVLIKHYFLIGKNASEAKKSLDKHYPKSAPDYHVVKYWFAKFKTGHMGTKDDERSGRPKEVVTPENIKKIHKIIFDDRKVTLIEIAETLKISSERVHHIIHEYLGMRKLCAKWMPRELTIDQKQQRVHYSEQCLKLINRNVAEFYRRYSTMNEIILPKKCVFLSNGEDFSIELIL